MIFNIEVRYTKYGDGVIHYMKNGKKYKVLISKKDSVLKGIFDFYYSQLKTFKNRQEAIAKWIVRDIRGVDYYFKAYAGNMQNIRPIKKKKVNSLSPKKQFEQQIMDNLHRNYYEAEVSDYERLTH